MTDPMTTPDKIRSYAHLPKGWHYGSGDRLESQIIELAIAAEKMLRDMGFPETDCFPGVGGEIKVTSYLHGPESMKGKRTCIEIDITKEMY
jgi:hypothetical protein